MHDETPVDIDQVVQAAENVVQVAVGLEALIAGFNGCPVGAPGGLIADLCDETWNIVLDDEAGAMDGVIPGRQADALRLAFRLGSCPGICSTIAHGASRLGAFGGRPSWCSGDMRQLRARPRK